MKIINGHGVKLLFSASILAIAVGVYLFYSVAIDGTYVGVPVIYWEGSFATDKTEYHLGEPILIRIVATKRDLPPGDVTWCLVSVCRKEITCFAARSTITGPGLVDTQVRVGMIPPYLTPGKYYLKGMGTWTVNALKTVFTDMRSNEFEILAGTAR